METDYQIFKYFKGGKNNPFDKENQNTQYQFWFYESLFFEKFKKNDFSLESWTVPYTEDIEEWKEVLSKKPVNRDELFKLWLNNLLLVHLPDKYQTTADWFLRLYFDSE